VSVCLQNGPVPSSSQPAVQPEVLQVPPPNQVVVKVETNSPPEEEEEEDEDLLPDDQSSASGAASVAGSIGDSSDIEKLAGLLTRPKGLADFKGIKVINIICVLCSNSIFSSS
jgi:hypothetical protein